MKKIYCDKCPKNSEDNPEVVWTTRNKPGFSPTSNYIAPFDFCEVCALAYDGKTAIVTEEKKAALETAITEFIESDPIPTPKILATPMPVDAAPVLVDSNV